MCAMALVHSRVGRVVYAVQDSELGALGGRFRLHAERSLNHHYKVYWLPLQGQPQMQMQVAEQLQQQLPDTK